MKKTMIGVMAAALTLTLGVTGAWAAGRPLNGQGQNPGCTGAQCQWIDANGDGICDLQGQQCRWTDVNGDGVCDLCGGAGYVDADGDGICDRRASGGGGMAMSRGYGQGMGGGRMR